MSDIFISYKREEQPIARKLADALEREGWSVWWDPKLRAGEDFDKIIEAVLNESRCVIVLWSKLSLASDYVRAEASEAMEQKKLVPVAIENIILPFRFKRLHTPKLLNWDGSNQSVEFRRLVEDISALIGEPQNRVAADQRVPDHIRAAGQAPYRKQEIESISHAIKTGERAGKLIRVIWGLVAIIVASAGTVVYWYTRPPPEDIHTASSVTPRKSAYLLIQSASEKALFTCTQVNQLKLKEQALLMAKQTGNMALEVPIKKQIQDYSLNIDNALVEYLGFLDQLAKVEGQIVVEEFDEYSRSLVEKQSFQQIQIVRLVKRQYEQYRTGNKIAKTGIIMICEEVLR